MLLDLPAHAAQAFERAHDSRFYVVGRRSAEDDAGEPLDVGGLQGIGTLFVAVHATKPFQ